MVILRNDIGIFCLVDKFNYYYLLNFEKRFWNIYLLFLIFKIILIEIKGFSIVSIYLWFMFFEIIYLMIFGKYIKIVFRFVRCYICF